MRNKYIRIMVTFIGWNFKWYIIDRISLVNWESDNTSSNYGQEVRKWVNWITIYIPFTTRSYPCKLSSYLLATCFFVSSFFKILLFIFSMHSKSHSLFPAPEYWSVCSFKYTSSFILLYHNYKIRQTTIVSISPICS